MTLSGSGLGVNCGVPVGGGSARGGSDAGSYVSSRRKAYRLQAGISAVVGRSGGLAAVSLRRVAECGRHPLGGSVDVVVSGDAGRARFTGLQRCGSVWSCPSCSASVGAYRRGELGRMVSSWESQGGQFVLLTLTVSHHLGESLRGLRAWLTGDAFRSLRRDWSFKSWWSEVGVVGYVKALEVTLGANGWHPHLHLLLFVRAGGSSSVDLPGCWSRVVAGVGGSASREHGCSVELVESGGAAVAGYLAKFGVEWELTNALGKRSRGGRSSWDLLQEAVAGGAEAARLWVEFSLAMKGARQLTFSRRIRELLGVGEEVSDEALVNGEVLAEGERVVMSLPLESWGRLSRAGLVLQFLEAVELGVVYGVAFLRSFGLSAWVWEEAG